ncbi:BrnA antitoxin family protein [Taklimakanibacter lacteus]|uniref:BrnA antitoxin family protein n=1 Tax=Taklimakanibacter lacteus TaxID=2268456 RepID=UPI000E6692A1
MKKKFSKAERDLLAKLEALPDSQIDTGDIPEAPAKNWRLARRGDLYRPTKQPVTIRIDADVLAWFKENAEGQGYQTEINRVLRHHVTRVEKRSGR